jgi:molybdenum-dependent DNA-binding transcriptional regulator ModE
MTAEGKGAVAELTQRGEKYRKAYKELGERLNKFSHVVTHRLIVQRRRRLPRKERSSSGRQRWRHSVNG